jgi:hypothetical protein
MKNYILGIVAIVMAIGFSAFTAGSKKQFTKPTTTTAYFWYTVNNSTGKISSTSINGTAYTKGQALGLESPFQPITACEDDLSQPLCLVGSTSDVYGPGDNIPAHDETNSILQKNEMK